MPNQFRERNVREELLDTSMDVRQPSKRSTKTDLVKYTVIAGEGPVDDTTCDNQKELYEMTERTNEDWPAPGLDDTRLS
jgi:hypothetical protein